MTAAIPRSGETRGSGRPLFVLGGLMLAVIVAAICALSVGAVAIPANVIVNTLFNLDGEQQTYIVLRSRLPRIVIGLLAGAALALSGAMIQAVIRNPLASPNIIGINSGAALFALVLVLFFPAVPQSWMPLAACLGGVIAAGIVMLVAHLRYLSAIHLALIGVAVGFVFESGVDYLLVVNTDRETSAAMIWLTGSLWGRTWSHVDLSWLPLTGLGGMALLLSYRLDLMALGPETATGLGLNVRRQRLLLLLVATLLASVAVAVVGVMGFIGLMAPHIEISAGILAALIGAPFFIYIMLTTASERDP